MILKFQKRTHNRSHMLEIELNGVCPSNRRQGTIQHCKHDTL